MDTELLRTFLEVDKTRHFGRAAENLYLTHAAVGARIRQLEGLIGLPVFTRHRNNVGLTPAGERLKPYAEHIIENWNQALQASSRAEGYAPPLSLGGTPNVWQTVLRESLHRFREHAGDVSLRAECHSSEFLTAQLLGRQLDLLVLFDPLKIEGVDREKLGMMKLQLLSSHPHTPIETAFTANYVQISWGINFNLQHAKIAGSHLNPVLHSSSCDIALDYVLRHGGSVYLPDFTAAPYIRSKQLFAVEGGPEVSQEVCVSYLKDRVGSSFPDSAIDTLKGAVSNLL